MPPQKSSLKRESEVSRDSEQPLEPALRVPATAFRMTMAGTMAGTMTGREKIESTLDKWHDDDLSIVASVDDDDDDEDLDGSIQDLDGQSLSHPGGNSKKSKSLQTSPMDLVRKETRAVMYLRYTILTLLLVTGSLLSAGTFRWVEKAGLYDSSQSNSNSNSNGNGNGRNCAWDEDAMHNAFVQALETNMQQGLVAILMASFSLSASFTSFALATSNSGGSSGSGSVGGSGALDSWPLVTIPHFETRVTGLLDSTDATLIRVAPVVSPVLRSTFVDYAVQEQSDECGDACPIVSEIYNPTGPLPEPEDTTVPIWQVAPFQTAVPLTLQNLLNDPIDATAFGRMQDLGAGILSGFVSGASTSSSSSSSSSLTSENGGEDDSIPPSIILWYPIFADFQQIRLASSLSIVLPWSGWLQRSIPFSLMGQDPLSILIQSCTGQSISFGLNDDDDDAGTLTYTGLLPDIPASLQQEGWTFTIPGGYPYGDFTNPLEAATADVCDHMVLVVPTNVVDTVFDTNNANTQSDDDGNDNRNIVLMAIVVLVFLIIIGLFLVYGWFVEKRQSIVVNIATKSSAIVENLFPAQVRDRMLQNMQKEAREGNINGDNPGGGDPTMPQDNVSKNVIPTVAGRAPSHVSVRQFLSDEPGIVDLSNPPIADLFPNTTVLFADIAGFTAWSSQREPPQVFTLLETLYQSFDVIAKKLKVFKVETIGDCYMAVTGLPNPDDAHAVHMSRFGYQCLIGMKELLRELEAILGPGTSDLALRVGLHSGPVTAGVLRGEKSRFQLFGDTVNTASRMESTGIKGKIQVSQETADLLMAAGKSHWLKPRDEAVVAKGKGELKTYWLDPTKKRRTTKTHKDIRVAQEIALNANGDYVDKPMSTPENTFDDKYARLIDWNVDVLLHHLARVISSRSRNPSRGSLVNHSSEVALLPAAINDVAEVVALPPFDSAASRFRRARPDVSMLQQTKADLHEYVKRIAVLYHDVPFHNFEHASHVTLCANKLLNRLVNSDEYDTEEELHNSTFGISSDPLTHFAIVFAALIHDVDHTGLPNAQLVKDGHEIAVKFDNRSVAEQNSVHLGWEMLMDPRFERLRKCIYQTNVERKRFRQLVINSVLATDIANRKVNTERQQKWDRAFIGQSATKDGQTALQMQDDMNRKGTAVIEHIIQVSDVAHTMQHWHIYRRWNERLFHEMHEAYSSGRVNVDPSTNWHIGELGFFDYYLIPLAMKLKECGVFGASGYEYISYVLKNKKEWERKGRQVVQDMVLLYKDVEDDDDASGSSFDSDDYDSDDLEYDSPGGLSSSEESNEDTDPLNP